MKKKSKIIKEVLRIFLSIIMLAILVYASSTNNPQTHPAEEITEEIWVNESGDIMTGNLIISRGNNLTVYENVWIGSVDGMTYDVAGGSLWVFGNFEIGGQLFMPSGTRTHPSASFDTSSNTGWYSPIAGKIVFLSTGNTTLILETTKIIFNKSIENDVTFLDDVRIGASTGESITMDGDDLYILDNVEIGGDLNITGNLQVGGCIIYNATGTSVKLGDCL